MINMDTIIGTLGPFGFTVLLTFVIISGFLWFLVPFWIINIKNTLKNIEKYLKNLNKEQ